MNSNYLPVTVPGRYKYEEENDQIGQQILYLRSVNFIRPSRQRFGNAEKSQPIYANPIRFLKQVIFRVDFPLPVFATQLCLPWGSPI